MRFSNETIYLFLNHYGRHYFFFQMINIKFNVFEIFKFCSLNYLSYIDEKSVSKQNIKYIREKSI